ncbi:MAG TPA: translation initiation factor IF-2 [Dehalococcoidia bacterium]|nr:translation initiation factor IF-2 [Dehalococcoidia bacterium]
MTTRTPQAPAGPPEDRGPIDLPRALTVKELADRMRINPVEVIKELMKNGVMATVNQSIDFDTAAIVATDFGFEPQETAAPPVQAQPAASRKVVESGEHLDPRPPIVTIMGHVDHGKTSLLDAVRNTRVTEGEAGGITQHIGASTIIINGQRITFLDTPGHEAFTAMRARGAEVTDIAVLVVAADDGVMPQTIEAINHARAAGVPLVVAINKIDLAGANPDRVKQELLNYGITVEEYGGETIAVPVSARTKDGLDDLLESLLAQAEILELRADPRRSAVGVVLEAEKESLRGTVATVLVQTGTLRPGDVIVAGDTAYGRVKAMFDERGRKLRSAGPSIPTKVLGLSSVPQAGDRVTVVEDERTARDWVDRREREKAAAAAEGAAGAVTLDTLFGEITAGKVKELNIVLKTDVQGSIEPIKNALERASNEQVRVKVIHAATGTVTESDVMLAKAAKGVILGFNTRTEQGARRQAEAEHVEIKQYDVIYHAVEDIENALKGMLEPVYEEVIDGHAEVRQIIRISRFGNIAGSYITDGKAARSAGARIRRGRELVFEGRVENLKRFKEDVREVATGYECGITLDGWDDFVIGDVIEFYHRERQS